MLKYLRIAVTALCLAACVLLAALWVRSYKTFDLVGYDTLNQLNIVASDTGTIYFLTMDWIVYEGWGWRYESRPASLPPAGFSWVSSHQKIVSCPTWFVLLLTLGMAAAPWLPWSTRFSLRTLLIAITLVAVGLGMGIDLSQ
jgi:hypothetical protein